MTGCWHLAVLELLLSLETGLFAQMPSLASWRPLLLARLCPEPGRLMASTAGLSMLCA